MNVLLLSMMYSARKFTGISVVNMLRDMVRVVNLQRDDVNWFFGVPCTKEYMQWDEADFADLDRVKVLPILAPAGMDRSQVKDGFCAIDHPWFGPGCFKLFADKNFLSFDVVISQYYTAQSVIRMQAEYTSKYHYMLPKVGLPAVVNLLTETGLDPSLFKLQAEIGQQTIAASMLASTKTLVLTHADATLAKQMARRWFSPSVLRDLEIEAVLPTLSIENVPRHKRPGGRCNFFHGGTFEAKRHLPALAAMTTQLVSMGKKCKLLLTTQNADVPDWLVGKEKFSEVVYNCGREEFLKQLQFGDFALCYIEYEGTGLATTEAIVSGMTPIVMWKPWNKGRFPEDYPFYCQGETEFAQAMHFCASDPKKAKEIGKQAVEHTRRIYSAESLGMQWSSILSDCLRKRNEETLARCSKHFMTGVIDTAIAKLKPIGSKQEALQAIASCSQSMEAKKLGQVWPQIRAVLSAFGCTFKTDDAGEELVVAP